MDEFRKKTDVELSKVLLEKREDLRAFRFGISGSKTRNIRTGRNIRKDIARILGELRARRGRVAPSK